MCQFCYISYFLFIGFCVLFEVVILSEKETCFKIHGKRGRKTSHFLFIFIDYNCFLTMFNLDWRRQICLDNLLNGR